MPTLAVGMLKTEENHHMPTASVGMAPNFPQQKQSADEQGANSWVDFSVWPRKPIALPTLFPPSRERANDFEQT